ncbi:MAG: AI-2E family transporter [Chloroflexota bacterium]
MNGSSEASTAPGGGPRVIAEIALKTLGVVAAAIVLSWLAMRLSHFLIVILFAVLLATAIDEPVSWLQERGVPRPLGIFLHYVALIALFAIAIIVLIPLVTTEARLLSKELPAYLQSFETWLDKYTPGPTPHFSMESIAQDMQGHLGSVADRLERVTLDLVRIGLYTFIVLVLGFFLAAEPDIVGKLAARFVPQHKDRIDRVAAKTRDRIGAWARGQLMLGLIFGTLMGVGLWLIGVPFALSLGIAAGILELLPYVGGLVTVVLAGITALSVGFPQVIMVVVLYLVLVNVESHILEPWLFGKAIGLPPVAILLALLTGVELLGIAGALLAIPLLVIGWVLVEEIWPPPAAADGGADAAAAAGVAPPGT